MNEVCVSRNDNLQGYVAKRVRGRSTRAIIETEITITKIKVNI